MSRRNEARWRHVAAVIGLGVTTSCGPGEPPVAPDPVPDPAGSFDPRHEVIVPPLDDPVVLEASAYVLGTQSGPGEYFFDMSSIPMIQNGAFHDLEITYFSPTVCDEDATLWNAAAGTWREIARKGPFFCAAVLTRQAHTVRDLYTVPAGFVDPNGIVRLRVQGLSPQARALRYRSGYSARRLWDGWVRFFDGLAFDGTSLWASSDFTGRIYELAADGSEILHFFAAPGGNSRGMAYDGEHLWVADSSDRVYRLDRDGTVVCEFDSPTAHPGGLAWGDDSLWLSESEGSDPRIYRLDPDASCTAGAAVVTDSFPAPGGGSCGLAWTGRRLLVASDRLHQVQPDGSTARSHALPVVGVHGIAWDGRTVVMINDGPPEAGNSGTKITRFRLR